MRDWAIGLVLVLAATGCRQILGLDDLTTDGSVQIDGSVDADVDAPIIPDASGCTALSSECVAGSVLRVCSTVGADPVDTSCPLSCSPTGGAHCTRIAPAGGGANVSDLAPSPSLMDVTIAAAVTINGDDGTITGVRTAGTGVISGIDYTVRNNIAIFRFKKLVVNNVVQLRGARPIVLVALEDITVAAAIDAQGPCTAMAAGPGGGAGGMNVQGAAMPGGDPGGGPGGVQAAGLAGSGGGHGAVGGAGGKSTGASTGGVAFGNATITTLRGGGGGGGGVANMTGQGGGGGGAVQLVANGKVELMAGGINAGGCGGVPGFFSGGGGGAGGAILLEARTVTIGNGVHLTVNGGGGGGSGGGSTAGTAGANGQPTNGRAPAGTSVMGGASGRGGAAAALAGEAGLDDPEDGGAGGGAAGRIRINTLSGTATIQAGSILSPTLTETPTTTTQGMLVLQ